MRRISIVIAIMMLVAVLSACGAPAPVANDDGATDQAVPVEEAVEEIEEEVFGPFGEKDMIFVNDGVEYPISTPAQPLLEAFGDGYEEIVADSCLYDGYDKQFIYDFATINTYPIEGADMIDEIYIYGGDFVTNRGIALGDTLEMVIEAYGEGGFEEGSSYVYALSGDQEDNASQRLFFDLTDGVITGISYYGANNNTP